MKKSLGAKTILYPTPVMIVATYDQNGNPNAMNAAWGGICSSNPPCVNVSIRPSRKTYENIIEKKAFTINIPSESNVKEADYMGIVSGKDVDKFAKAGLTALRSDLIDAPIIKEFPMSIECKLINSVEIGVHTLLVGEILDVKVNEDLMNGDSADIEKIKPILYDMTSRSYFGIGQNIAKAFSVGNSI